MYAEYAINIAVGLMGFTFFSFAVCNACAKHLPGFMSVTDHVRQGMKNDKGNGNKRGSSSLGATARRA